MLNFNKSLAKCFYFGQKFVIVIGVLEGFGRLKVRLLNVKCNLITIGLAK